MAKQPLTPTEIRELISIIRDLFAHHERLRNDNALGTLIQNPKIPSVLSESIVFRLLESGELLGHPVKPTKSTSGGDLEIQNQSGPPSRVEVKATGKSAFQLLSPKDLDAHHLIWVHFDDFFENASRTEFTIHRTSNVRDKFPHGGKITLQKFLKLCGDDKLTLRINAASLRVIK